MNIYQKLINVRKVVPYLQKENKGYQFNYVSSSQVLASVKQKLDELGLLLIPKITGHKVSFETVEYVQKDIPKKTTTYFTELDLEMIWLNAECPEEVIVCPWYGQGVDTAGEKGVGKALTYAEKYFMLKFFNIPTDKDDPDAFQRRLDDEPAPQTTTALQGPASEPVNIKSQRPAEMPAKGKITYAQAKRMFALAKGDTQKVQNIIKTYGYTKTTEIDAEKYDEICDLIEKGA